MRALYILVAATLLGLIGGYAWSVWPSHAASGKPPKAGFMPIPPSPDEQPAPLDREWEARAHEAGKPEVQQNVADPTAVEQSVYYSSCKEAWAAGHAPVRSGEPGYSSGLDGDNDGIACEPIRHDAG